MATIDLANRAGNPSKGAPARSGAVRTPYIIGKVIDFADAVTAKGSALAQADVIQALDLPAYTVLLGGGVQVVTAMTGTSTDVTLDIGVTGGDVDNILDGFDFDGASVGAIGATIGVNEPVIIGSTADTLDILIATQTNTLTGGSIWVWAMLADVSPTKNPGIAALQS